MVVVADGDKDKAFTNIASGKKMPMDSATNVADVGKYLKAAVK